MNLFAAWLACGGEEGDPATGPTWTEGAREVVTERCASCHRAGDIAPFPLETYEEVTAVAALVGDAVEAGRMPPWKPSRECNSYAEDIGLTDAERALLLAWIEAGTPEGPDVPAPEVEAAPDPFEDAVVLKLPEAYTPTLEPDDYRCQIVPWPLTEGGYVTGLRVLPDQAALVHHTIVFAVGASTLPTMQAYDDADPGPGYTCFGGPTGTTSTDPDGGLLSPDVLAALLSGDLDAAGGGSVRSIGAWVPGVPAQPFPAGTGLRMEPGDALVVQMHYNTSSAAPVADQSSVAFLVAPEVDRPAVGIALTDLGWVSGLPIGEGPMTIPAGDPDVSHETVLDWSHPLVAMARQQLGAGDELLVHRVGAHMHNLGRTFDVTLERGEGEDECLLAIGDWDFAWQGGYTFEAPTTFADGDAVRLRCSWDNSAGNQPSVDGVPVESRDVSWGEGTSDEMCLGNLYVTLP